MSRPRGNPLSTMDALVMKLGERERKLHPTHIDTSVRVFFPASPFQPGQMIIEKRHPSRPAREVVGVRVNEWVEVQGPTRVSRLAWDKLDGYRLEGE